MTLYLILISLALFGFSNGVITKRSNRNQQNFQQYEIQTFAAAAPASPLTNIIDAISTPLNILRNQLSGQPGHQRNNPGYGPPGHQDPHDRYGQVNNDHYLHPGYYGPPQQYGPPPHRGPPPLRGPHYNRRPHDHYGSQGHHGQQQNNAFQYPQPPQPAVPSFNPFFNNLPSREPQREQFDIEPMKISPQNPFLNKNTTSNPEFSQQPGSQFNQGQFPQNPNFSLSQNYPKPGFSNYPGNAHWNGNANNHNVGNNGFDVNNFGGSLNNGQAQSNNGIGTQNRPSQGNGLIQSTFGGFGTDANQTPQSQPTNQFGNDGLYNNYFGGSSNLPQPNNGFGTQNTASQGNGLIQTTFGDPGSNGNQTPQSQSQLQPQVNNAAATQNGQINTSDLIQSTFSGFGPGQQQSQLQPPNTSKNEGLISSIFGDGSTEKPQTNNEQNPSSVGNDLIHSTFAGFGPDGVPISQPQTQPQPQLQPQTQPSNPNQNNDLISSIFAGLPETPQTNGNAAQDLTQSGFGTPPPSVNAGNNLQTMSAEMKTNNDLIESIFAGTNNGIGQNVPQPNLIGTSTVDPPTTNSNGFIYDIDVRSS